MPDSVRTVPDAFFSRLPMRLARVELRQLAVGDLPAFMAYRSDPQVARFQGWAAMDESQAAAFLCSEARVPRALQAGDWHQLGIALPDGGASLLIGDLGLWLSPGGDALEFGISLASRWQGRGHAREALLGLLQLLAETTDVRRVVARTDARNAGCLGLLRRLGMHHTGSAAEVYKGEPCIDECFELALERRPR